MVKCLEATILEVEKNRKHVRAERDKSQANLVKAHEALRELERALQVTVWERNTLKVHVAGIGGLLAKAREEVV